MRWCCRLLKNLGQKGFWKALFKKTPGRGEGKPAEPDGSHTYTVGEFPTDSRFKYAGQMLLTLEQRKEADQMQRITFSKRAGAIFLINPSVSFLISSYYGEHIDISQTGNKITMTGELRRDVFKLFEEYFGLLKRRNVLVFRFEDREALEHRIEELESRGVVLPKPQEGCLYFTYGNKYYQQHGSNASLEAYRLRHTLEKHFPDNPFHFSYSTDYTFDFRKLYEGIDQLRIDDNAFWDRLYYDMYGNGFQVSLNHRTIAFDFETEDELNEKIAYLKSFPYFDIYHRRENHRYKFNVQFEMSLRELAAELKRTFPNLTTKLVNNGEKLIVQGLE